MKQAIVALTVVAALVATQTVRPNTADAAFHCMRIVAVSGGASGNPDVQYVELRMTASGQTLLGGHQLVFQDGSGTEKAAFTFPSNVSGFSTGSSILVATQEFYALTGLRPDFTFTTGTTVPANGGDALHPVQTTGGRVMFRENPNSPSGTVACHPQDNRPIGNVRVIDSVAYGSYPGGQNTDPDNPSFTGFGTPAASLPLGGSQALILTNAAVFINDSAEYTLMALPAAPNIPSISPPTSPRNNAGTTGSVPPDVDQDLAGDASDNCASAANPGQENYDEDSLGDACDPDDDGDGYSDAAESGTPLCNGVNNDSADDSVIDDGCPGGPPQSGSFSEAQFNIGTKSLGRCEVGNPGGPGYSSQWPADLADAGGFSRDKVNISDLSAYVGVPRIYGTTVGNPDYNQRLDVVPGPGAVPGAFINIADLQNVAFATAPMFGGARMFSGPTCTNATHTVGLGDYWYGSRACYDDDSGACSAIVISAGDSVRWTNTGAEAHTATHCPDGNLGTCGTPTPRAFDTPFPPGITAGGTSASFQLAAPGTYLYRCQLHPGPDGGTGTPSMRARIIVN